MRSECCETALFFAAGFLAAFFAAGLAALAAFFAGAFFAAGFLAAAFTAFLAAGLAAFATFFAAGLAALAGLAAAFLAAALLAGLLLLAVGDLVLFFSAMIDRARNYLPQMMKPRIATPAMARTAAAGAARYPPPARAPRWLCRGLASIDKVANGAHEED